MTIDDLALARISEDFLVRTFALSQEDEQFGTRIQSAVDADSNAIAIADSEGGKLEDVADKFGLAPNDPLLSRVDAKTQAYIAPMLIKLADAFAGALIAAKVKPEDLARIVPQKELTTVNSNSFAAHGNASLAKLFSPT